MSKLCWFCARSYHLRSICPSRNTICYKCQKKGHFSKVCKSKSAKTTNASICTTSLCAIHKTPDCLTHASFTALIANTEVSALIDTGSSSSFINADTAERLGMKIIPCYKNIPMASSSSTENIHGYCNTDMQINGSDYNDVKLKVLKNLCSDILLGHHFQSQHRQVIFENYRSLPESLLD